MTAVDDAVAALEAAVAADQTSDAAREAALAQSAADLRASQSALAAEVALYTAGVTQIAVDRAQITDLQAQLAAALAQQGTHPAIPVGWATELYYDGFDSIDPTNWSVADQIAHSNEQSFLQRKNVTADGMLHVVAKAEPVAGHAFTSGYLHGTSKLALPVDRLWMYETRVRLNLVPGKSSGLWPAPIWFRNANVGEMDGLEAYGTPGNLASALKPGNGAVTIWQDTNGGSSVFKIGKDITPIDWSAWITIQFTGNNVTGEYTVSFDGKQVQSVNPKSDSWAGKTHQPASWLLGPSYKDAWVPIINQQISKPGSWGGVPDAATAFPVDMQVDYVRALLK